MLVLLRNLQCCLLWHTGAQQTQCLQASLENGGRGPAELELGLNTVHFDFSGELRELRASIIYYCLTLFLGSFFSLDYLLMFNATS